VRREAVIEEVYFYMHLAAFPVFGTRFKAHLSHPLKLGSSRVTSV
jgi:hypothetical protein